MANIYSVRDYLLFSCNASGTASTKSRSKNICEELSELLDVDVVYSEASSTDFAFIYPIKTEEGSGGGCKCYFRISKTGSNSLQFFAVNVSTTTTNTEITHQGADIPTGSSLGPVLHYMKIGNYVCLGISTGALTQMDMILDTKNHAIAFNAYNTSTGASTFRFINSSGNAADFSPQEFTDATAAVSLSPILIPTLDLIYNDLFTAAVMRSGTKVQQYIINDESFFACGSPNANSETAPQFVVGEAEGG